MNAFWNVRPRLFVVPALLVLYGMLLPGRAAALQQEQQIDENGRSALERAQRGASFEAPAPEPADVWKGCDADDCSARKVDAREAQPAAGTGELQAVQAGMANNISFRVQPGAPAHSVYVAGDGNIGIGTETPQGRLHVVSLAGEGSARDIFLLDANGNLEIGGVLTEASSALLKQDFAPVAVQDVLARLAALPVTTWKFKTDDPTTRHMGPTAQDFHAAFGLGAGDDHIAPLDANGVALAALQALHQREQAHAERIAALEQQNALLLERLQALEALVKGRAEEP